MREAVKLMQTHRCRPGGKPVGRLGRERPSWGEPGQLTKVDGEERWGRVMYLMTCCGERIVAFAAQDGGDPVAERFRLEGLINPYGAYPAQMPPRGYLIIDRNDRSVVPFGGPRDRA